MTTTKTKKKVTKSVSDEETMKKAITNLTSIVSQLETDVKRIKVRMGI
tara:strand:+ start:323 stop:466 length:144 start_codon:yes stop_codon:yes gene_type:complete